MREFSAKDVHGLVGEVYRCASDSEHWPVFLKKFARRFGAKASLIRVYNPRYNKVLSGASFGYQPPFVDAYRDHFINIDPYRPLLKRLRQGAVTRGSAGISDAELVKTEFYDGFLRPQGFFHTLGSCLHRSANLCANLAMVRSRRSGPFSEQQVNAFRPFVAHAQQAVLTGRLLTGLSDQSRMAERLLDSMSIGLALINAAEKISYLNRTAIKLLSQPTVGARWYRGRLRISQPGGSCKLTALIHASVQTASGQAAAGGGYMLVPGTPSSGSELTIMVSPVYPDQTLFSFLPDRISAVMFLATPKTRPALHYEAVQALYGLTDAEARLANKLLQGQDLPTIANEFGVSHHTVRAQLRALFRKTTTRKQHELVALLASIPRAPE